MRVNLFCRFANKVVLYVSKLWSINVCDGLMKPQSMNLSKGEKFTNLEKD